MIVHLFNQSRAGHGIMQGLMDYFCGEVVGNIDFVSLGDLIKPKSDDIFRDLKRSKIIFMGDQDFFHDFFDRENLWNRVIFYDYRDTTNFIETIPLKVPYFKRSLFKGNDRKPVKFTRKIKPISHFSLKEYFVGEKEKIYDFGCFFDLNNKNIGCRRLNLLSSLLKEKLPNSLVGVSTGFGNNARISITSSSKNNNFLDFISMQSQCKIIFTAQPELVDGDNRTWEALSSGALVFCENPMIHLNNPIIQGKHCFFFNANSMDSIKEAIEKANCYIANREDREIISKSGVEFVKKYHMGFNRIEEMLSKSIKL